MKKGKIKKAKMKTGKQDPTKTTMSHSKVGGSKRIKF